jgi:hypothetical protein
VETILVNSVRDYYNLCRPSELGLQWKALDPQVKQEYKDRHARLRQEMLANLSEEEIAKRKVGKRSARCP